MERKIIQQSIFSFLKIRKVPIIIFTGIVVIFGILFYLYDIPFDAIIYGSELSFVWSAVCLLIDFYKYYKRHKLLHINREQFFENAEELPEYMDIIECDYQELVKELSQAKQDFISQNRIARKEMLDYYGMWVHQIKTPIAAMDILLQNTEQFLYEEDIVNSRINKRLEIIQESIPVSDMKMELFKIEQYVEMALNYLRVEDISSDLSFKKHAVDDMVRQVIRKYAKIFISKKIKMNFKPTGSYIVTDDKWFVFVLEQLISNALKYTKQGQISIYMEDKSLVIEDSGIGIPAEDLPRIFEKGFTGYNGRENKKSTGIGLYLCKNIMDKLQWNITADSEVGSGTKIYLTKM
nr:sensor histidine kinase [uncultured Anaerobutyricum sp.]